MLFYLPSMSVWQHTSTRMYERVVLTKNKDTEPCLTQHLRFGKTTMPDWFLFYIYFLGMHLEILLFCCSVLLRKDTPIFQSIPNISGKCIVWKLVSLSQSLDKITGGVLRTQWTRGRSSWLIHWVQRMHYQYMNKDWQSWYVQCFHIILIASIFAFEIFVAFL